MKLGGIIKPIDVHAETEPEMTSNFVIKVNLFINILPWINNTFPIGNQEYLTFIIYIPIRQFIMLRFLK